jgi:flagellar hook-length control protein FliK
MRSAVPSVASEPNAVLPPRPYQPSVRGPAADSGQPPSPFAELLDSAITAASEPPRPQQPADRGESSQAAPAKDSAPASDSTAVKDAPDSKNADAGTAAPADGDAKTNEAKAGTGKSTTDQTADTDAKAKPTADDTAALDALFGDAAPATPAPIVPNPVQSVAVALALPNPAASIAPADVASGQEAVEAGAIAALQAAGQPVGVAKPAATEAKSSPGNTKPAAGPGDAKPSVIDAASPAEPQAKIAAPTDPQTAISQADAGKDGASRANPDNAAAEVRHTATDAAAKIDSIAPTPNQTDASAAVKASADAMQNLGQATQANQASAAAPAAASAAANASAQTQAALVPVAGLAVEIATQAHAGKNHFEIRLDPPELGRIDVRLHVDRDGNVSSRLVVDRADTLDLLKRDQPSLERALQQAGLKTSDNAMEFSLRQQQNFTRDDTPTPGAAQLVVPDDDPAPLEALRQGYGRLLGLGGGLDIRV